MDTYEAVFLNLPIFLKRMERPMQEAIRTAHDAFGYTPGEFVRDLTADTTGPRGEGYTLPFSQAIDPGRDPYRQMDLRSCLKYLCCGGLRITGYSDGEPEFAKDQDTFFVFFGVDMYYTAPADALWRRRLCAGEVGRALMHLYRMLFVQDETNRESLCSREDLAKKLGWMITALQPLCDTRWEHQEVCAQLQRDLVKERFRALDAELALAKCKLWGKSISRDRDGALRTMRTLAAQDHGPAIKELAECYLRGLGVERDFARAEALYLQAADCGDTDALNALGCAYWNGRGCDPQPQKALALYLRAAQAGNAEGQFFVGRCYLRGDGVARDIPKAHGWLHRAAEQGYAQAMCDLGRCCAEEIGVPQDMTEAERWFRKAANSGLALAGGVADAIAIGVLGQPEYTPERLANAVSWLQALTEEEDTLAAYLLERLSRMDA